MRKGNCRVIVALCIPACRARLCISAGVYAARTERGPSVWKTHDRLSNRVASHVLTSAVRERVRSEISTATRATRAASASTATASCGSKWCKSSVHTTRSMLAPASGNCRTSATTQPPAGTATAARLNANADRSTPTMSLCDPRPAKNSSNAPPPQPKSRIEAVGGATPPIALRIDRFTPSKRLARARLRSA